ncbi:MAG: PH domain-containing protein, partial [Candidatus Sumerlaeota bacterium]
LVFLIGSFNFVAIIIAILAVFFIIGKILFLYVVTRLDYEMRYYIITDRSLRIREGVVIIREITLTFENIQNMRITQGPIQRMFGLYDLVVETAGGGGSAAAAQQQQEQSSSFMHRGVFRGIGRPEDLRDLILRYLKQVRSSGLGDIDDEEVYEQPIGAPATKGRPLLASPETLGVLRAMREETAAMRRAVEA